MERVAWTDERLDDLARRMDAGFARVDEDIRELRREMHDGFGDLGRRMDDQGAGLRGEIKGLRITMLRVGGGMLVGLVGVIAAILARGG